MSEHPKCRIKLTVLDESSGKGKAAGHKVKLTAALVLAGTTTEGLSKPGRCEQGGRAGRGREQNLTHQSELLERAFKATQPLTPSP